MSVVPAAKKYHLRLARLDEDQNAIVELWKKGLTHGEKRAEIFQWLYLDNPAGQGEILLLAQESVTHPLGAKGITPRNWSNCGKALQIGLFGDFIVDPAHRSLGPGLMLLKEALARGHAGYPIIYGFPNKRAESVYQHAGYRRLVSLPTYRKVLKSRRNLARIMPRWVAALAALPVDMALRLDDGVRRLLYSRNWRGAWVDLDERFDRLWERADTDKLMVGERSCRYLRWRFGGMPSKHYEVFGLLRRDNDELDGYVVCQFDEGGGVAIVDLLAADWNSSVRRLLTEFVAAARKRGCRVISMELQGPDSAVAEVKAQRFVQRSARSVFGFKRPGSESLRAEGTWYVTSGDEGQ